MLPEWPAAHRCLHSLRPGTAPKFVLLQGPQRRRGPVVGGDEGVDLLDALGGGRVAAEVAAEGGE